MFDPLNYQMTQDEIEIAEAVNGLVEALSDGVDLADAPAAVKAVRVAREKLSGAMRSEIRRTLAKVALAQVFDELAEEGHI